MDALSLRDQWQSLVSVATLGVARMPLPSDTAWPGSIDATIPGQTERTLLRLAAATVLWQLAGRRSPAWNVTEAAIAPVGEEPRAVSEEAARRLVRMLAGEHSTFVPEWFSIAESAGLVLPPHWLPPVLDSLKADDVRRYAAVLGEAAAWLATLNPAWHHRVVSTAPSEDRWLTGDAAERVAELTALRRTEPARARQWVEASWQTDSAEDRERFVRALFEGLSSEDESFLEAVLDDRRKEVRGAAVECLLKLPESAHASRMRDRVDPLISFTPGKRRLVLKPARPPLDVTLPVAPDKTAVRDGIVLKPSGRKATGEREFWLKQMVSAVAPAHWTTRFSCEPASFVDATVASDHGAALLEALTAAAVRHRAVDWVDPLIAAWSNRDDEPSTGQAAGAIAGLFDVLPREAQQKALAAWLSSLAEGTTALAMSVLTELPASWDEAVTSHAFERLRIACRRDTQGWSHPRTTLASWAHHVDPAGALSLASAALDQCPEASPWRAALQHLTEIVGFRADMHKELHS